MKQTTNSNQSLAQLLNHRANSVKAHRLFAQALDLYLWKGLITEKERTNLSMKASLSDDFLYEQFVASRAELGDVTGYPFSMIGSEDLLEMLKSGNYSWEDLDMMDALARDEMMMEISLEEEE